MKSYKHQLAKMTFVCLLSTQLQGQFASVEPTGLPYHIIVSEVLIDGLPAAPGTELGFFDDTLCVGVGVVPSSGNIDVVTWEGSTSPSLPGFTAGNVITAKLYANIYGSFMEMDANISFELGGGTYGSGSYSVVSLSGVTGIAPNIYVNNSNIQFGPVSLGETAEIPIEITNQGNVPLNISSVTSNNDQFEIANYSGEIAINETISLNIGFSPSDASQISGEITIVSNDPDDPNKLIYLSGQGVPPSQAVIGISTDVIDFGTVNMGSSTWEPIEVFNTGAVVLTINSLSLSSSTTPFSIQEESFSVEPGNVYSLNITFSPTSSGSYNEQLTLWSNASNNSAISVNLSGVGYDSYFLPVPPTGLPYSVIVQNVNIDGHGLSEGDEIGLFQYNQTTDDDFCVGSFVYDDNSATSIQAVAWEEETEQGLQGFTPGSPIIIKCWATTFDSTIEMMPTVEWSVGNGSYGFGEFSVVALSAESGIAPEISLNTYLIEYPPMQVGQSYSESVFITNTGETNLTVNNISTDNDAFNFSNNYVVVEPEQSAEIYVVFTPQSATPHEGHLLIQSNDPTSPEEVITLLGQGLPETSGELDISFDPISFSSTIIGESSLLYLPLFNSGSEVVVVSALEFECDEYSTISENGFEIDPGEIAQLPISFSPTSIGLNNCIVSITNSSINHPYFSIELSGIGYEGFFNTVSPTGLPHTIVVESLTGPFDTIQTGDEIGIFDGSIAVGVIVVTDEDTLSGVAWEANMDNDLLGFSVGNPISFRYFTHNNNDPVIYDANHITITGTGNFGHHPYTSVTISATNNPLIPSNIQSIPDINTTEDIGLFQTGVFLNEYFTHPYDPLTYSFHSPSSEGITTELSNESELLITTDENWFGITDIFVSATDGYFTVSDTTLLTVDNINDAPTISHQADTSTFEDTHLVLPIIINDIDEDELDITFLTDVNLISASYDNGFATFIPAMDSSGLAIITAYVSDGELIDSMSFSLTIIPVNDAPGITPVPDLTMMEDDTLFHTLEIIDVENDSISVFVESLEPNINVTTIGFEIMIIPEPNWFGSGEIQVIASDSFLQDTIHINVSVESANDAPTITHQADTSTFEDTHLVLPIIINDIDEDELDITFLTDVNLISASYDNGFATFIPAMDSSGLAIITAYVSDGELIDSMSFSLTIIPVNDAPGITPVPDLTMMEDDTLFHTLEIIDVENDSISVFVESLEPNINVTTIGFEIMIIPEPNWFGSGEIQVIASDSFLQDTIHINVSVENANDAPTTFELVLLDTVFITIHNVETEPLTIEWGESFDEDNDEITYAFEGDLMATEENGQIHMMNMDTTLTSTSFQISYQELFNTISSYEFGTAELIWNVFASDGIDSVWASNGPAEVYIDIQEVLSTHEGFLPKAYALYQNYPNPFNPTTTFEYDLPKASDVTLRIYDITGREVNQIQFFQKPAGKHRFVINGSDLGSGMYFLHFSSGFFQSIKKMILLK